MKNRYMVAILFALMASQGHAEFTTANTAPAEETIQKSKLIEKVKNLVATLQDNITCVYKWNCTPTQRQRIRNTAIAIAALMATLSVGREAWEFGKRLYPQKTNADPRSAIPGSGKRPRTPEQAKEEIKRIARKVIAGDE